MFGLIICRPRSGTVFSFLTNLQPKVSGAVKISGTLRTVIIRCLPT